MTVRFSMVLCSSTIVNKVDSCAVRLGFRHLHMGLDTSI
jgi:hypothetical protein